MTKILITGATGFIGGALFKHLKSKKRYLLHLSSRTNQEKLFMEEKNFNISKIDSSTNWKDALDEVDCVIHCAASVHTTEKKKIDLMNAYRRINVDGTTNLANQAVKAGVKRFVFLSSVKVNGERTVVSKNFKYDDIPRPEDAYGISKWEAEQALLKISKKTGLEVVIIRPALVYGERVKGNFLSLLDLVYRQVPLPFANINNLRSFIGLDNLIDLIICCIDHPKAGGKIFLVSDGEDLSTSELIRKLSKFMNKSARLFYVPQSIIRLMGHLVGKSLEVKKLLGSLRVDNCYTREVLGWSPVLSLDDSLEKTVCWYLKNR